MITFSEEIKKANEGKINKIGKFWAFAAISDEELSPYTDMPELCKHEIGDIILVKDMKDVYDDPGRCRAAILEFDYLNDSTWLFANGDWSWLAWPDEIDGKDLLMGMSAPNGIRRTYKRFMRPLTAEEMKQLAEKIDVEDDAGYDWVTNLGQIINVKNIEEPSQQK